MLSLADITNLIDSFKRDPTGNLASYTLGGLASQVPEATGRE